MRLNPTPNRRTCGAVCAPLALRGMLRADTQEPGQGEVCGWSQRALPTEVQRGENLALNAPLRSLVHGLHSVEVVASTPTRVTQLELAGSRPAQGNPVDSQAMPEPKLHEAK